MKIQQLRFVNFAQNNKFNNINVSRPKTLQATDKVSFGANDKIETMDNPYIINQWEENISKYSDDELLNFLEQLRYDKSISDEAKSEFLLQGGGKGLHNPIIRNIQLAGDDKDNFYYRVAKAMIEASPDIKTTEAQLLTPDKFGQIPMHYAKGDSLRLLLDATPNKDLLARQLFAESKSVLDGITIPFVKKSQEDRAMILEYCDEDLQGKLLAFPKLLPNVKDPNGVFSLLDMAPNKNIRNSMLLADDGNGNILCHRNKEELEYLLTEFKDKPDILKKLLTRETDSPIETCDSNAIMTLINASPDEETLKAQLLKYNKFRDCLPINRSRNCGDKMALLAKSPDQETLLKQLNSIEKCKNMYEVACVPLKGTLSPDEYTQLLTNIMQTNQSKKDLLLSDWRVKHYNEVCEYNRSSNVAENLKKSGYKDQCAGILDESDEYDENKRNIIDVVLDIIEDDSTTKDESLRLIRRYGQFADKKTQSMLSEIENRLIQ